MTLQIGRITGLPAPMDWQESGDACQLVGRVALTSALAGLVLRDQLLGYDGNDDEPVVPIIHTTEPRLTGFYVINSVAVPTDVLAVQEGLIQWKVDATRIDAFRASSLESMLNGAMKANDWSIVSGTAEPYHAFPSAAWEYSLSTAGSGSAIRASQTGNVIWIRMNPNYRAIARYSVLPAHHYDGAVQITDISGGAANHVITGRKEAPTNWAIDNGLVRIGSGAGNGFFNLETWNGSAWVLPSKPVQFLGATQGQIVYGGGTDSGVRILRNSPEACIVRYPALGLSGGIIQAIAIDFALRRGSRVVEIYLSAAAADTWTMRHQLLAPAYTALTGGIRETANDSNGNRLIMMSAKNFTSSLGAGSPGITNAGGARKTFDAGLGVEYGGSGATTFDVAQSVIYQYLGGPAERMQVVGR